MADLQKQQSERVKQLLRLLFVGTTLILTSLNLQAQNEYPVVIAFDAKTGFIIDASEAQSSDLFPAMSKENLNYMILIGNGPYSYKVLAVYNDGSVNNQWYNDAEVRIERSKVSVGALDSVIIPDYSVVKNLVREARGFYYITDDFSLKIYNPFGSLTTIEYYPLIFGTFGTGVSLIEYDRVMIGFATSANLIYKRLFFSAEMHAGRSELFFAYLFNKEKHSFNDFNLRGGIVLLNSNTFIAVSTGYSFVNLKVGTKKYDQYNEVDGYNYEKCSCGSIPVVLNISFPANTYVGLYTQLKSNFIFNEKTVVTATFGLRFGRTSREIRSNQLQ